VRQSGGGASAAGYGANDLWNPADIALAETRVDTDGLGLTAQLGVEVGAAQYDVLVRMAPEDLGGRLDPAHARHALVEDHDIGVLVLEQVDRICSVGCFAADGQVVAGRTDHGPDEQADVFLVVDDQHRDLL